MRPNKHTIGLAAALTAALLACGGEDETRADAGSEVTSDSGGDLGADVTDEIDTRAPEIGDLTVTPNRVNPLTAWVELTTDEPATIAVAARDDSGHEVLVGPSTEGATAHRVALMGMRFGGVYEITVTAWDTAGNMSEATGEVVTTPARPDTLPPFEVTSDPHAMSPGVTLFTLRRFVGGEVDNRWGALLAVDAEGEIIWYQEAGAIIGDTRRLDSGHLLFLSGNNVVEMTMMGEVVQSWNALTMTPPSYSFHHEVSTTPEGTFLVLGRELRVIDGYPDPENEGETVAYNVVGDLIVEFDRDGRVLHSWSLLDLLEEDQLRINPGFHASGLDRQFPDADGGTKDWSHGNAVVYDAARDLILVSARTLDWVVAFNRTTGELAWRLGCQGDFALTNGSSADEAVCHPEWQYHQHAPEVLPDGTFILFDNGNTRPGTGFEDGQTPPYSRAVIFSIDTSGDPADWTATMEWEYVNDSQPNYAQIVGDADLLENGNILVTEGGLRRDPSLPGRDPGNPILTRITEVTRDDPPVEVFEITIEDPTPAPESPGDLAPLGWNAYRAERLPSLYGAASPFERVEE